MSSLICNNCNHQAFAEVDLTSSHPSRKDGKRKNKPSHINSHNKVYIDQFNPVQSLDISTNTPIHLNVRH